MLRYVSAIFNVSRINAMILKHGNEAGYEPKSGIYPFIIDDHVMQDHTRLDHRCHCVSIP